MDIGEVHTKGQCQRAKIKVTKVNSKANVVPISAFPGNNSSLNLLTGSRLYLFIQQSPSLCNAIQITCPFFLVIWFNGILCCLNNTTVEFQFSICRINYFGTLFMTYMMAGCKFIVTQRVQWWHIYCGPTDFSLVTFLSRVLLWARYDKIKNKFYARTMCHQ